MNENTYTLWQIHSHGQCPQSQCRIALALPGFGYVCSVPKVCNRQFDAVSADWFRFEESFQA